MRKFLWLTALLPAVLNAQSVVWNQKSHSDYRATYSVSYSADGSRVLSSSQCTESQIRIWDATTGQLKWVYEVDPGTLCLHAAKFSSNTNYFATVDEVGKLLVFDNTKKIPRLLYDLNTEGRGSFSIDFSADNQQMVLDGLDGNIRIYDVDSAYVYKTLIGHKAQVKAVDWSPNGAFIVSGSNDGTMKIWNPATGQTTYTFTEIRQPIVHVKVSNDNNKIIAILETMQLKVYDASGYYMNRLNIDVPYDIHQVDISFDNKYLAVASAGGALLYETKTGQLISRFNVPDGGTTYSLAFHPHSYDLVTGSENGDVAYWRLNNLNTSVTEAELPELVRIYPNPANTYIQLANNAATQQVTIINLTGQVVMQTNTNNTIDVSELTNGLYYVKVNNGQWQTLSIEH
ncbi:MAG: T9SS C-terminal target domain-containing protein [Bacteroidetes bacterium]|nr:MAG: T9SS C-terminal target domain-containing protein [Bacteroidota bacterium]